MAIKKKTGAKRTLLERKEDRVLIKKWSIQGMFPRDITTELAAHHEAIGRAHDALTESQIRYDLKKIETELASNCYFDLNAELKRKWDQYEVMIQDLWKIIRVGTKAITLVAVADSKTGKMKVQKQIETAYKNIGLAQYFGQLRGVYADQAALIGLTKGSDIVLNIINQFSKNEDGGDGANWFDELPYEKQKKIMDIVMDSQTNSQIEDAEVVED